MRLRGAISLRNRHLPLHRRGGLDEAVARAAAQFLRLTLEKLRLPLLDDGTITEAEFAEAVAALEDPAVTVIMPMTVAGWGWRT